MPKAIKLYVRYVDTINRTVGRFVMYLIFVMMGILLFAAISRSVFDTPYLWVIEMAQFTMAAYYLLGGGYSMQLDFHVRMDLVYERLSVKKRAFADSITAFCLIFYLIILFYGGLSSTEYAIQYGQKNYSAWGPPMAPIKIIMTTGIFLMLLQAIAIFFRDLATVRGKSIS
ncbi:MAG: TRAP transporter small permease subunit [Gammaproteobacteria bacterium]|nr:TRAP transporter small permease subunit [Gammaproteobacteria bacterium]